MVQVALGARVVQVVVEAKSGVVLVGVAIWRVAQPVLVRVMVWMVAVGPGTLLKTRTAGMRARAGWGLAKRVSGVVMGAGGEEVVEVRVRVAVWGPAVEGVNWTPSQQLVQGPVKVEVKAALGELPWPKPVSSTRMALKSGADVVAVRVAKGEVIL